MSKSPRIVAAGGVVLREHKKQQQVLLIYRKTYKDWSLPKGKGRGSEYLAQTAVREILEETGVHACLNLRLSSLRYKVSRGWKAVHYWRGTVISQVQRKPDAEVQKARWFNIPEALERVSYDDERELIQEAVSAPETTALVLVRHAKAIQRKEWEGPDQKRGLTSRGQRQARRLRHLFAAYRITRLKSSSSSRCMDTLRPYAEEHKLKVKGLSILTEEEGTKDPKGVAKTVAKTVKRLAEPTAICGHRPVLPFMYDGLGIKPRDMMVAEALVLHLDADKNIIATELLKPMA